LPTLFSLYIDDIIRRWQTELKDTFYRNNIEITTLLFADDQVILANSEDNLQRAIHRLNVTSKVYNMRISKDKTKALALRGKDPTRIKIFYSPLEVPLYNILLPRSCEGLLSPMSLFVAPLLKTCVQ
jgi:hypothetical protein